jgi:hypothetical protein
MKERKLISQPRKSIGFKADILPSERLKLSKKNQKRLNDELLVYAINGDNDMIKKLLRAGADIAAKQENGMNALHLAAYKEYTETCALLIKNGADVDAKDSYDRTAYTIAKNYGCKNTAKFLMSLKAT